MLAGISVAVVARSFPWWACVLGKAAVTLSSVYLLYTSPWLEIADAYLVSSMSGSDECKRFPKWCPTSRACTHIFWTRLLLSGRDSRTLGQELGVKCIISTSMFNRQPKEYSGSRFPLEHAQVGGVTNFVGQTLVFKRNQNASKQSDLVLNDASTLPRRDLRFVSNAARRGVSSDVYSGKLDFVLWVVSRQRRQGIGDPQGSHRARGRLVG